MRFWTERDAEYRRALGVKPGEPLPKTIGTAPPSGASKNRRRALAKNTRAQSR